MQPVSCFLQGTQVKTPDGTTKPIEEVVVGDAVLGPFNELNFVSGLHRTELGSNSMYKFNNEHMTTNIHPYITPNREFHSGNPTTLESMYCKRYEVICGSNSCDYWELCGIQPSRIQQLNLGDTIQSDVSTAKTISTIEEVSLPPTTLLYNLVVGGSHAFCADGYAVTGWPREDDFNYNEWSPCMYLNPTPSTITSSIIGAPPA